MALQQQIRIVARSPVPKYRQIVEGVLGLIRSGSLKKGDRVPSLNAMCTKFALSQDTVLLAYSELKSRGILTSSVGKGYFVSNARVDEKHRVFLLFDKLAPYKETLFEAFKGSMKGKGSERLYFHYNDPVVFRTLIEASADKYTEYVVMPISNTRALESLKLLPARRTFMLDQGRSLFASRYPGIYQDFRNDIRSVLSTVVETLAQYETLVLVVRQRRAHLNQIADGFRTFCKEHDLRHEIVGDLGLRNTRTGGAYVIVDDRDLITLVKQALAMNARLGSDIGIISYNESPLKEVIAGGITTISTDFRQMGCSLAEMILTGDRSSKDNPFTMVRRQSF